MTPDELSKILLLDEYQVLNIPQEDFAGLEPHIGTRAYTYRAAIGELRIKVATQIHGTISGWAAGLIREGEAAGAFDSRDLFLISKGRLQGFMGEYEGIIKVPDCAIVPRRRLWPTLVFEFGYAEPYEDLKADVKLLLEGSAGKISKAIIIKLDPLHDGETEIQRGFVEIWHLVDGQATKHGCKKSLFPPPRSHEVQKLELPLGDILRSQLDDLANEGWGRDDTIALYFDPLREYIEEATWRHLVQKGVLECDDESD
ncbi:unnamed protein product [Tuber aestivum]|uniref:Restriction endonuclease domain-containing protein n=1 Tax=Tuber aestivum TaxID=59557 RepID=A0A292Q519_9PEZI|nr:unnamed protein product [Tuber aestivum]